MTLYELTRKLVERGCPEHPRLLAWDDTWYDHHPLKSDRRANIVHPDDAGAIWTMWALEWFMGSAVHAGAMVVYERQSGAGLVHYLWAERDGDDRGNALGMGDGALEAIEAATRHLEPTNA